MLRGQIWAGDADVGGKHLRNNPRPVGGDVSLGES